MKRNSVPDIPRSHSVHLLFHRKRIDRCEIEMRRKPDINDHFRPDLEKPPKKGRSVQLIRNDHKQLMRFI
jgi:hypothetical protein